MVGVNESSRAVVRTMRLLELLAEMPDARVTELSSRLGMHKSTTYRFLNSLCELKYVRQNPDTERYSISLKLFELGAAIVRQIDVWREAHPVMERLAHDTNETVHLAMLEDDELVYLHKIESTQTLRVSMMSQIGRTAPLHCTGLGKCLLAFSPAGIAERIMNGYRFEAYTDTTITTGEAFEKELQTIRAQGYSVDNEEHERGIRCVAAPIGTPGGGAFAALSISVPSVRLGDENIERFAGLVQGAAARINERLRRTGS